MFPFCFEWVWDAGHLLFFGGFWFAISILGAGMTWCILKALYETIYCDGSDNHH